MTVFTTRVSPNPAAISQDATNRTRVSQSTTQFDGKLLNADSSLLFDSKGTGTGSFRPICSQVSTEGSIDESGYNNSNRSILTAAIPGQTVADVGTSYAVCGVRKKSTHRDVNAKVTSADLMVRSVNDYLYWELVLNPTLSAPLTYSAMSNSACEFGVAGAVTAISITASGGRVLHGGPLSVGVPLPTGVLERDFLSFLGCTIDNVMDQIVLVVTPITAAITLNGSINWKEY